MIVMEMRRTRVSAYNKSRLLRRFDDLHVLSPRFPGEASVDEVFIRDDMEYVMSNLYRIYLCIAKRIISDSL